MTMAHETYTDRYGKTFVPDENAVIRPRQGIFSLLTCRDHTLLCFQEHAPDCAELPGGGIDPGETPDEALMREFAEETGLSFADVPLPAAVHKQRVLFYAEDQNEFWHYDQEFRHYDLPENNPLFFDGERLTPEDGIAVWIARHNLETIQLHQIHAKAMRELLAL